MPLATPWRTCVPQEAQQQTGRHSGSPGGQRRGAAAKMAEQLGAARQERCHRRDASCRRHRCNADPGLHSSCMPRMGGPKFGYHQSSVPDAGPSCSIQSCCQSGMAGLLRPYSTGSQLVGTCRQLLAQGLVSPPLLLRERKHIPARSKRPAQERGAADGTRQQQPQDMLRTGVLQHFAHQLVELCVHSAAVMEHRQTDDTSSQHRECRERREHYSTPTPGRYTHQPQPGLAAHWNDHCNCVPNLQFCQQRDGRGAGGGIDRGGGCQRSRCCA